MRTHRVRNSSSRTNKPRKCVRPALVKRKRPRGQKPKKSVRFNLLVRFTPSDEALYRRCLAQCRQNGFNLPRFKNDPRLRSHSCEDVLRGSRQSTSTRWQSEMCLAPPSSPTSNHQMAPRQRDLKDSIIPSCPLEASATPCRTGKPRSKTIPHSPSRGLSCKNRQPTPRWACPLIAPPRGMFDPFDLHTESRGGNQRQAKTAHSSGMTRPVTSAGVVNGNIRQGFDRPPVIDDLSVSIQRLQISPTTGRVYSLQQQDLNAIPNGWSAGIEGATLPCRRSHFESHALPQNDDRDIFAETDESLTDCRWQHGRDYTNNRCDSNARCDANNNSVEKTPHLKGSGANKDPLGDSHDGPTTTSDLDPTRPGSETTHMTSDPKTSSHEISGLSDGSCATLPDDVELDDFLSILDNSFEIPDDPQQEIDEDFWREVCQTFCNSETSLVTETPHGENRASLTSQDTTATATTDGEKSLGLITANLPTAVEVDDSGNDSRNYTNNHNTNGLDLSQNQSSATYSCPAGRITFSETLPSCRHSSALLHSERTAQSTDNSDQQNSRSFTSGTSVSCSKPALETEHTSTPDESCDLTSQASMETGSCRPPPLTVSSAMGAGNTETTGSVCDDKTTVQEETPDDASTRAMSNDGCTQIKTVSDEETTPLYMCPILGCGLHFSTPALLDDHLGQMQHSPCNPLVNLVDGLVPASTTSFLCPACGTAFQDETGCLDHMLEVNHARLLSPVPSLVYTCPECLSFFPSVHATLRHMENMSHRRYASSFPDDGRSPDQARPVPVPYRLMVELISQCQRVFHSVVCQDCGTGIADSAELGLHLDRRHVLVAKCCRTVKDVFSDLVTDQACAECGQFIYRGLPATGLCVHTDCPMQGPVLTWQARTLREFLLRCGIADICVGTELTLDCGERSCVCPPSPLVLQPASGGADAGSDDGVVSSKAVPRQSLSDTGVPMTSSIHKDVSCCISKASLLCQNFWGRKENCSKLSALPSKPASPCLNPAQSVSASSMGNSVCKEYVQPDEPADQDNEQVGCVAETMSCDLVNPSMATALPATTTEENVGAASHRSVDKNISFTNGQICSNTERTKTCLDQEKVPTPMLVHIPTAASQVAEAGMSHDCLAGPSTRTHDGDFPMSSDSQGSCETASSYTCCSDSSSSHSRSSTSLDGCTTTQDSDDDDSDNNDRIADLWHSYDLDPDFVLNLLDPLDPHKPSCSHASRSGGISKTAHGSVHGNSGTAQRELGEYSTSQGSCVQALQYSPVSPALLSISDAENRLQRAPNKKVFGSEASLDAHFDNPRINYAAQRFRDQGTQMEETRQGMGAELTHQGTQIDLMDNETQMEPTLSCDTAKTSDNPEALCTARSVNTAKHNSILPQLTATLIHASETILISSSRDDSKVTSDNRPSAGHGNTTRFKRKRRHQGKQGKTKRKKRVQGRQTRYMLARPLMFCAVQNDKMPGLGEVKSSAAETSLGTTETFKSPELAGVTGQKQEDNSEHLHSQGCPASMKLRPRGRAASTGSRLKGRSVKPLQNRPKRSRPRYIIASKNRSPFRDRSCLDLNSVSEDNKVAGREEVIDLRREDENHVAVGGGLCHDPEKVESLYMLVDPCRWIAVKDLVGLREKCKEEPEDSSFAALPSFCGNENLCLPRVEESRYLILAGETTNKNKEMTGQCPYTQTGVEPNTGSGETARQDQDMEVAGYDDVPQEQSGAGPSQVCGEESRYCILEGKPVQESTESKTVPEAAESCPAGRACKLPEVNESHYFILKAGQTTEAVRSCDQSDLTSQPVAVPSNSRQVDQSSVVTAAYDTAFNTTGRSLFPLRSPFVTPRYARRLCRWAPPGGVERSKMADRTVELPAVDSGESKEEAKREGRALGEAGLCEAMEDTKSAPYSGITEEKTETGIRNDISLAILDGTSQCQSKTSADDRAASAPVVSQGGKPSPLDSVVGEPSKMRATAGVGKSRPQTALTRPIDGHNKTRPTRRPETRSLSLKSVKQRTAQRKLRTKPQSRKGRKSAVTKKSTKTKTVRARNAAALKAKAKTAKMSARRATLRERRAAGRGRGGAEGISPGPSQGALAAEQCVGGESSATAVTAQDQNCLHRKSGGQVTCHAPSHSSGGLGQHSDPVPLNPSQEIWTDTHKFNMQATDGETKTSSAGVTTVPASNKASASTSRTRPCTRNKPSTSAELQVGVSKSGVSPDVGAATNASTQEVDLCAGTEHKGGNSKLSVATSVQTSCVTKDDTQNSKPLTKLSGVSKPRVDTSTKPSTRAKDSHICGKPTKDSHTDDKPTTYDKPTTSDKAEENSAALEKLPDSTIETCAELDEKVSFLSSEGSVSQAPPQRVCSLLLSLDGPSSSVSSVLSRPSTTATTAATTDKTTGCSAADKAQRRLHYRKLRTPKIQHLSTMTSIVFADLENFMFFKHFRGDLPDATFVWGFISARPRAPFHRERYFRRFELYRTLKSKACTHISTDIGFGKDAVDFAMTLAIAKLDDRLPANIPFYIVSRDGGFREVENQMRRALREVKVVAPCRHRLTSAGFVM